MNGTTSEISIDMGKEKLKRSLIPAEVLDFGFQNFDKSKPCLQEILSKSKFTVIDVGPGFNPPKLSVDQKSTDLWIGADIALKSEPVNQMVARGSRDVEERAKRILVPGEIEALPKFTADLIMIIAPNPKNIVEDDLLGQIDKFVGPGTRIYILLDNRTAESHQFGKEAKAKIVRFLKEKKFTRDDLSDLDGRIIDPSGSQDAIGGTIFKGKKIK